MPVDLVLKNAKICTSTEVFRAGLAIDGDRIARIAKEPNLPPASEEMNLSGLTVLPGLIDAHVHLRDQKLEYKEDFYTGTAAAANGGVTLVIDMPNNVPVTMDAKSLRERMSIASRRSIVNVAFYSAFPSRVREMRDIVQEGAKAFKLYMSEKIGGLDPDDEGTLVEAFREAANLNVPVSVHAEDRRLLKQALTQVREANRNDVNAYVSVHSTDAEVKAITRVMDLVKKSHACTHVCHVSSGKGMKTVESAKLAGLPVTCEVTPHHLLLSSRDLKDLGPVALTNPPLRSIEDMRSLWSSLRCGIVDILASDHAPHSRQEKEGPSFWDISPGIAGVEALLPLMLTQVSKGHLPLSTLVRITSERPAEIFRIANRGVLKEGNYADLVVVDLRKKWRIDSSIFQSKEKFSPFDGWQVKGKPVKTFVNGRLVMDEGEIVGEPGDGRIIR